MGSTLPLSLSDLQEPFLTHDGNNGDNKEETSLPQMNATAAVIATRTAITLPTHSGSTLGQAVFNFTNAIVGAGAIGLGGAMAQSGGAISIASLLFFAALTKLSLDLLVRLSLRFDMNDTNSIHLSDALLAPPYETNNSGVATQHTGSYEGLGKLAFGWTGQALISASKFMYSFGCLIAYIIVVKDNMASAIRSLLYGSHAVPHSFLGTWLQHDIWVAWTLSTLVILPLCLLRDMTPMSRFSMVSVAAMLVIVGIVIYLFYDPLSPHEHATSEYEDWWRVRPGYLNWYVIGDPSSNGCF
jgi:amino acid permease